MHPDALLVFFDILKKNYDYVICSSFTFSASVNPIIYLGASPIFIDSEQDTWNMDPSLLEQAIVNQININKKPKAIILVHLYGYPSKIEEIVSISKKYDIPIIEDAAEALGSKYKNQPLGTFGDIGIFSFNGNKIITTSSGGAILSKNKEFIRKAKFLATQAREDQPHYEHKEIGYNYRMSNVCAAIGLGQLEVLEKRVAKRRYIHDFYKNKLSNIESIKFLNDIDGFYSNRWLTTIVLEENSKINNEKIRLELQKNNIESRPLWKPMHLQPVFKGCESYLNGVSEDLFNRGNNAGSAFGQSPHFVRNNTSDEIKNGADAAVPVVPIADSLRSINGEQINRDEVLVVQTPQALSLIHI